MKFTTGGNLIIIILIAFLSIDCKSDKKDGHSQDAISKIILVRHAEKATGEDPVLTAKGIRRAERLAELLKNEQIENIYSTDYKRTKGTAAPVAKQKNMQVLEYDPADLPAFARTLKNLPLGTTSLVVGHSNTTPVLVNILDSNKDYPQIDEANYENIYIVEFTKDGLVQAVQSTFKNYIKEPMHK